MPSCDLPETVYKKWIQMSGRRGTCLYVATIDDMMRAIMQSIDYEAYLKMLSVTLMSYGWGQNDNSW